MLIPATTEGRVQRILIHPGTPVRADSVVMVLTSQELETDLLNAEYALKAAEADYANLKVTLEKLSLDMQSTAAQVDADYNTAKLQADRDAALAKEGLFSRSGRQNLRREGRTTRQPPATRTKAHLASTPPPTKPSWPPPRSRWISLRGQYNLKKSQVTS